MTDTSFSIEFLPSALQDITEVISSFVMLGSKQGALRIKEKINKAAEQIQRFPYSGVSLPDKKLSAFGFRMMIIEKYIMFYKVFDDEAKVIVYHFLNGKTNYPSLMKNIYLDK